MGGSTSLLYVFDVAHAYAALTCPLPIPGKPSVQLLGDAAFSVSVHN